MRSALLTIASAALAGSCYAADLTGAVVVLAGAPTMPEKKAAGMLIDEVARRTGVRWTLATAIPTSHPAIVLGQRSAIASVAPAVKLDSSAKPEGFSNGVARGPLVYVAGSDPRGVLFGTGHLLRNLEMRRGKVELRDDYAVVTAPQTVLRGHQLGYRPKPNSYDGWDLRMWEQYIRDLVVFGANAIELIPPRSDDDPDSPHFPAPQMETMIGMSKLIADYGLDVWVWYPAMDDDYSDPKTVEFALREWGEVFRKLPRIDAVLVPAGDPGHTPAPILLPLLEKQTANLRKYHPKAGMWIAPQGFDEKSVDFFIEQVNKRPAWLSGIVYGPQTRISLPDLRARLPKDMPIRHYPDITHTRQSQYPVPDWDVAWAHTSSREPINPRPVDQAKIFRTQQKHTFGFITYSEGCNDDVNKAIWAGLGWSQEAEVFAIVRDYARYFIGPDFANDFAHGLMSLEQNWRGPALTNGGVEVTLAQFQDMEKRATPQMLLNWRFQQALYRAYYDAYVQRRLIQETALEDRAMQALRDSEPAASFSALDKAEGFLDQSRTDPVAPELRVRIFQLAEALFQSIRMQLSVDLYQGLRGRGNTLDSVDAPLNSRFWLKEQFARIRSMPNAKSRAEEVRKLVNWTNPGPGGFYDDLGNPSQQARLISGQGFETDPQYFRTPQSFFTASERGRKSWWDQIIALYEQPLSLKYTGLDPAAKYKVRAVYGAGPLRLKAEALEVHGYVEKPFEVLEFAVPQQATADGTLTLHWNRPPGGGGPGRGCQVAEVWLVKDR